MPTLRILWGALFAATFIYLGVLVFLAPAGEEIAPDVVLVPALALVASSTAGASLVLPGVLYRSALAGAEWTTREVPAPDASMLRGQPTSSVVVLSDPAGALRQARTLFLTPFIIGMATAEAVALFGFVLGWLGHAPSVAFPFFAVSWALMLWHFPRDGRITGPVEEVAGARFVAAVRER